MTANVRRCVAALLVSSTAGCPWGGALLASPPQFEGKADSGIAVTARAYSDRGGAQLDVTIRNDGKNPVTLNYLLDDFTAKAGGATFACKKPLESYPNGALNPGGSQTISLHCADLDSATIESVNVIVDQRNATVALQKTAPPR